MTDETILRLRDLPSGAVFQNVGEPKHRAIKTRWEDPGIGTILCVEIDRYSGNLEPMPGAMPVERLGTFGAHPCGVGLGGAAYTPSP